MHSPIKHHPYLSSQCIKFQTIETFKKLLPQNTNALHIEKSYIGREHPYLSYLHYVKRLKRVKVLTLKQSSFESRSKLKRANESLFLVKSFRKSLQCLSHKSFFNRNCQKNLYKLSKIDLDLTQPESYKVFPFHRQLTQISFPISSSTKISAAKKSFEGYNARFKRFLSRLSGLRMVRISASEEELRPTINLLRLLEEVPGLIPNLRNFILHLDCDLKDSFLDEDSTHLPAFNVLSCLPYVTSFSLKDSHIEMLLENLSQFRNIQALNVLLKKNNISQLSHLKNLNALKYLKVKVEISSKQTERKFFEVFSLPSSLVSIDLTIEGDMWEDCRPTKKRREKIDESIQKERHFYSQWKGLNNLKHFKLKVRRWWLPHLEVESHFVMNIMKYLKGLESCIFTQSHHQYQRQTLKLKEFLEAIKGSRNTLKILKISSSSMNFVDDFSPQSLELSKLKEFSLKGSALSSPNTAQFLNNLSVKDRQSIRVNWKNLEINNLKTFEAILKSLIYLPKTVELHLILDICSLTKENWLEVLRQAIIKMKFEAKVDLTLWTKSDISGKDVLEDLRAAALGNPRFEHLFIKSRFDSMVYHIFSSWQNGVSEEVSEEGEEEEEEEDFW